MLGRVRPRLWTPQSRRAFGRLNGYSAHHQQHPFPRSLPPAYLWLPPFSTAQPPLPSIPRVMINIHLPTTPESALYFPFATHFLISCPPLPCLRPNFPNPKSQKECPESTPWPVDVPCLLLPGYQIFLILFCLSEAGSLWINAKQPRKDS